MSINPMVIVVNWQLRWSIYQRLTLLGISCRYAPHQPLEVEVHSPTTALYIWSVVRQLTADRATLVNWLERCWQLQDIPPSLNNWGGGEPTSLNS